jgi:hypothetical protein
MNKMEFKVRCVRECLVRHGFVYTARGYDLPATYVWVEGVGRCFRRQVAVVEKKEDLLPFVKRSGFVSVEAWWEVLQSFVKGRRCWVYYVFVRNAVGE